MKNGFTLIELIAVIALMALAGIASVSLFSSGDDADLEEDLRNKYVQIQTAAVVFVDLNDSWLNSFTNSNEIYVKLGELQNNNYVSKSMTNPLTNETFPSTYLIKVFKTMAEEGNENTTYVDTCIVSNTLGDTICIANSKGESCSCGNNNPCC